MYRLPNKSTKPESSQPRYGSDEVNIFSFSSTNVSCHSVDDSSTESASTDETCRSDDLVDALDFPFDLFEVDYFMEENDDALIGTYQDLIVEAAAASHQSSARRLSMLAVMNHISASTTSMASQHSVDCNKEPVETIMQKLDQCMRRTAESRAQLFKLNNVHVEDGSSNTTASTVTRSRRLSLSLKYKLNVGKESLHKKKTQLKRSKDGRRVTRRPFNNGRHEQEKLKPSEFVSSGVLLKRVAPSSAESKVSQRLLTEALECSGVANQTRIHHIMTQSKKAGRTSFGTKLAPSSGPSGSIASFLRQSKKIQISW